MIFDYFFIRFYFIYTSLLVECSVPIQVFTWHLSSPSCFLLLSLSLSELPSVLILSGIFSVLCVSFLPLHPSTRILFSSICFLAYLCLVTTALNTFSVLTLSTHLSFSTLKPSDLLSFPLLSFHVSAPYSALPVTSSESTTAC